MKLQSRFEIGKLGEEIAIDILKHNGFIDINHLSKDLWTTPIDISAKKGDKEYLIEVKSSTSGNYITLYKTKLDKLRKLENVLFLFVGQKEYSIVPLDNIKDNNRSFGKIKVIIFDENNKKKISDKPRIVTKLYNTKDKLDGVIIKDVVKRLGRSGYIALPNKLVGKYVRLVLEVEHG